MSAVHRFLLIVFILNLVLSFDSQIVHSQAYKLFINEFMASNNQTVMDNYGEYDDWIEIYNEDNYSVNLSGFYLTDDLSNPTKWICPDVSIPAKGLLLIWADDDTEQGDLHTNFKLDAAGEQIGLYDGSNFIDSLTFGQQTVDISYGCYPDGGIDWHSFLEPTPNAPNNDSMIDYAEAPTFSPRGGFYYGSVTVELSVSSPTATIRYTLDCYDPTEQSLIYTGPIVINKTTVIRARTFEHGYHSSKIATYTYLIDEDFDIATLSLVTDPPNLWDADYGIYDNPNEKGEDWERPASIEYYHAHDSLGLAENIGIRIHGKTAQNYEKKPFRFYFRNEYGSSWLNLPLFPAKIDVFEFKRLILHSGGTDMPANPYGYGWTLLRDPLMYELGRRTGCPYPAIRPVAVYLNSEPWGIYNLEERIDKYYTTSNFGEFDVDVIENDRITKEGDLTEWEKMRTFFQDHDLSLDANYETAKTFLDIENFTNYNIVEIFGGNEDWPGNNQMAFRPRKPGAIWRWILWDMDGCFGPYGVHSNTLGWATRDDESTFILRKLLENKNYKYKFINRYADLLNTIFLPTYSISLIDSLAAVIRNDITFEIDKWGSSLEEWEQDGIQGELYDYANKRPDIAREDIEEVFSLSGRVTLTITTPQGGQGRVKVNSIHINEYPWHGIYFKGIPIPLTAIADPGYRFVKWSDPSLPQEEKITITLYDDYSVYAVFEPDPEFDPLVINEINYHSASDFNPEDWVELYNPSDKTIDLSGWHFKDDDDSHDFTFPEGSTIDRYGFIILCNNKSAFQKRFPEVTNCIGDFNFGLGNGGDEIRIYNGSNVLIDSVTYNDQSPWSTEPDGNGPTLELIDPDLNNTIPENWQAGIGHGSPGMLTPNPIIINEINYNSAPDFNPEDWLELYNTSSRTIDLSGWHFKDDDNNHDFTFPEGTTIDPYGFLILCNDQSAFHGLFPEVTNYIGNFDIDFGSSGDEVKIYDASKNLVDSVLYDDESPWPTEPNGSGPTLELIDPGVDNILPENWQGSAGHGTPEQPASDPTLPEVTCFVVKDSSGSTEFTVNRKVLIEMTETDRDGEVVKWLVNESSASPEISDFTLTGRPTSYHITGAEGNVTVYGWVLDNNDQISTLTSTSYSSIKMDLSGPSFTAQATSSITIDITYNEQVDGATDAENYHISPSLGTIRVSDQTNNLYRLTTSLEQISGELYTLKTSNVKDLVGNPLVDTREKFFGYEDIVKLNLTLLEHSYAHLYEDWSNAIDNDIEGWDGTVSAKDNPSYIIFGFADSQKHAITKFRLLTDTNVGFKSRWVREFRVQVSTTDMNSSSFSTILDEEKVGGDWQAYSFERTIALYVKFIIDLPLNDWQQLGELEILGSEGSPPSYTPEVTSFVVKDSSGSIDVTDNRDVLIEMTETDSDGEVVKWLLNENSTPPIPEDFVLESRPASYHILGEEGDVIIYGWVLDEDNQVSRLTDESHDTIKLKLGGDLFNISGTVKYDGKEQFVSDVVMTLTPIQGTGSDTTDVNGNYVFSNIDAGDVTLESSKQADLRDAIMGSDVLLVLQYLAYLVDMTDDEKFAADVTQDDSVTDSDAQAILRYLAYYTDNIGSTGQWRFIPKDTSFSLNSDTTINVKAYLLGDANLNWEPGFERDTIGVPVFSNISLKIEPITIDEQENIEIPLLIDAHNETVNTLLFSLKYDPNLLIYQSIKKTCMSKEFLLEANGIESGQVHVAMAGIKGIQSSGEILRFIFKVVDPSLKNQRTNLTLTRVLANDRKVTAISDVVVIFPGSEQETVPDDFALFQNYPNPFNYETQIRYQLPVSSHVRITIYNIVGKEINTIVNNNQSAGSYRVIWDGKDNHGKAMPSGVFIYEFKTDGFVQSNKMIMMK